MEGTTAAAYTGTVAEIVYQLIGNTTNDIIIGTTKADFINASAGDDAVPAARCEARRSWGCLWREVKLHPADRLQRDHQGSDMGGLQKGAAADQRRNFGQWQ